MTKRARSDTTSTEGSVEDRPCSSKRADTQQDDVEAGSHLEAQAGLDRGEPPLPRRDVAKPSSIAGDAVTSIKIFNMNLNGLMKAFSRKNKRLENLLKEQDPDIVVFTETHYDPQAPMKIKPDGMAPYQRFKNRYAFSHLGVNPGSSGRAGVGVYSKIKPSSIVKSLPTYSDPASTRGRYVQYEYSTFYLVAVYTPHSGNSDKTDAHEVRKKWDAAVRQHLHDLNRIKPVICTGDHNVAPTNDDVYKATGKLSHKPVIGCILPHEREAWFDLLKPRPGSEERTLVDVWREKHPDEKKVFSHVALDGGLNFFSGFRLDHFVVSEELLPSVHSCEILSEETAMSDHIPVVMEIRIKAESGSRP